MLDGRVLVRWPGDDDYVEADRAIQELSSCEEELRSPSDAGLLRRGNWQLVDMHVAGACFDLDENNGPVASSDQVDLARGAAKVPGENPVFALLEKPRGETLPVGTQSKVITRRWLLPEQAL